MAGNPADDSLIKLARSLDQSSAESVPETLSKLWSLLSQSISSSFHAPEELVLRWLLKNMNGSAETAEKFRRFPLTWSIISCVFKRIPLISLSKSLADRRFIPILQLTLNEISKPQNDASVDVDMLDAGAENSSKKRKRSSDVQFGLESLRVSQGCLTTAESLLGALRTLLELLDPVEDDAPFASRMGAEHIKSLFCSPAKDAADLLRPILSICDVVLQEQDSEPLENQDSWIATFSALWNFHLQSSGDAAEVAMSLYPTGCIVMAKMDRSKDLVMDPHVKSRWARDLRRFFTKNMILPVRAAFLNRKDIGILKMAVDVTNFMPTASCPVLFNLAVRMPYASDDAIVRKDHLDWTQKVFEVVEEPIRNSDVTKRNQAMKVILDTAIDTKASISLSSLRTVCRQHTSASSAMDLNLVVRVATLDVDTFLISNEGHALLDEVFKQVNSLSDTDFANLADARPIDLIQLLAKGYARGRDLVGFLKKWLDSLAECFGKGKDYSLIQKVWSSDEVVGTVSSLLQSSVNTRQLLVLLEWLEDKRSTSNAGALLVVLNAISQGVNEEEYVDAVSTRLYDIISQLKLKSVDDSSKAAWWQIIENTVSWSTLDQSNTIWISVSPDLKKILKKGDLQESATIAAFHCCNRFWLANFRGGANESDAAALACSFSKRLQKNGKFAAAEGLLKPLMLSESPRIVELAPTVARNNDDTNRVDTAVRVVVHNENVINNSKYSNGVVQHAIKVLSQEEARKGPWAIDDLIVGFQTLLELPSEALSREQREKIMPKLLQLIAAVCDQEPPQRFLLVSKLLSLMIKIMSRPTYYEGMKFADLVAVGEAVIANLEAVVEGFEDLRVSFMYDTLYLYEDLALVTLKQMASSWEGRELGYFTEAFTIISSWAAQTTETDIYRLALLTSLTRAIQTSKVRTQCQQVVDSAAIRTHTSALYASLLSTYLDAFGVDLLADNATMLSNAPQIGVTLVALEHIYAVDPAIIKDRLASRGDLEALSNLFCERGFRAGWRLKELVFSCFGDTVHEPLFISAANVTPITATGTGTPLCARADIRDVSRYISAVLKSLDGDKRDRYVLAISQKLQNDSSITGLLLTVHQLLKEDNDPSLRLCVGKLDLAELHSVLASRLVNTQDSTEFALIAQTLCTLLDQKANAMKQWNTELTLSVVSTLCSTKSAVGDSIKSSPKTFTWLCRLVEIIIKRHRLRLEGHFHLLITTLQSLLHRLIVRPTASSPSSQTTKNTTTADDFSLHESQAKLFSRLLTLICEPSVASVTRGQPTGLLDSATDAAKRSAGQHMYLVLIAYVKLQLEHAVPRVAREALQPGMYSILDITTQEGRRILNEAVDGSGRAIFKDMYRRYVRFGKWSGI